MFTTSLFVIDPNVKINYCLSIDEWIKNNGIYLAIRRK